MTVPTIDAVTPARGHTSGGSLVEVTGSGFRTWVIPAPTGLPSGDVWPTLRVLFGGVAGSDVAVVSDTRLFVRTPVSPLPIVRPDYGEGAVDVTVQNLAADGSVVPGEEATRPSAFRFERPQLSDESDLGRVVKGVVYLFRSQVLANTSITTHSDYDRDTSDLSSIIDVAELPAVVIFGPRLVENREHARNGRVQFQLPGGEFVERPAPETDDLVFQLIAVTESKVQATNLQAAVRKVFAKNTHITIERDPARLELGSVSYELVYDAPGGLGFDVQTDQKSNLRSFSGSFSVRGFDHEDLAGFPGDDIVLRGAQVQEVITLSVPTKKG